VKVEREKATMGEKRIRLGFIGGGFIGQLGHIQTHAENPRVELHAIAERRPGLRRKVAERHGFSKAYATGEELLADREVDAGKHLLTEKPMCGTVAQAERLVEAATANGLVYQIAYHRRHDLGGRAGKKILEELLESNELGTLNYVRYHCFSGDTYRRIVGDIRSDEPKPEDLDRWPMAPDWLTPTRRSDYEHFVNAGCHFVNIVRFFLGDPLRIRFVDFRRRGAQLIALDSDRCPALIEIGDFGYNDWDDHLECYFSRGRLRVSFPAPMLRSVPARIELFKGGADPVVIAPQVQPSWAFDLQARAFIDTILDGAPNVASGADAITDMRLIEEAWRREVDSHGSDRL
jgi:predicted dehydrogenase